MFSLWQRKIGTKCLENCKLLVFPRGRQREEQAKPPARGAAGFHSNSCKDIHQQVPYCWAGWIWKAHPQTHTPASPSHNHLPWHVPPVLFTCMSLARPKLSPSAVEFMLLLSNIPHPKNNPCVYSLISTCSNVKQSNNHGFWCITLFTANNTFQWCLISSVYQNHHK